MKYLILSTPENYAAGYPYGYTDEKPPASIEYLELQEVNGTTYAASCPAQVVNILEDARRRRDAGWGRSINRLIIEYGDTKTGQSWGDIETGYIGRCAGTVKVPIVIYNRRFLGGPQISTGSIIKITQANGKQVLWQHPTYQPAKTDAA